LLHFDQNGPSYNFAWLSKTSLNDYFTSIGGKIGDSCSDHTQNLNFGNHMSDNLNILEFTLHPVNESQIFRLLNNLSISKSTGCDKIPAKILKYSASVISPYLTNLFNSSIGMGIFPSEWKIARVVPLHKKGSRSVLDNYFINYLPPRYVSMKGHSRLNYMI
jgi:intein/homing endonuclease